MRTLGMRSVTVKGEKERRRSRRRERERVIQTKKEKIRLER